MKYRKKPIEVTAYQWLKGAGNGVTYYQDAANEDRCCQQCEKWMNTHGWIETLEGGFIVCPGDWVIRGIRGELYPCKPDIFEATYEPAELEKQGTEKGGA